MSKNKQIAALKLGGEIAGEVARERITGAGCYHAESLADEKAEQSRKFAAELNGLPVNDTYHEQGYGNYFGSYRSRDGQQLAAGTLFWRPDSTIDDLRTPPEQFDPAVAEYMRALPPGSVAEMGSVVKVGREVSRLAMMSVYREMFRYAEQHAIDYFVAGLHPKIWPSYKRMFADGVRLMHAPDTTVLPPGAGSPKMGVVLDVANSAKIYRDNIHGRTSSNWPAEVFGRSVDGDDPTKRSKHGLADTTMHLLIFEYFRNRVESFKNISRI